MNTMRKPILVVEDERDIRENMVMLLEDEGYVVYSASNGKEALEVLRDPSNSLPGLIALDFYMPVMDGRAFLDAFEIERREKNLPQVTILLVTAATAQARAELESKTVGVLRKPIDIEEFIAVVEKYCQNTH